MDEFQIKVRPEPYRTRAGEKVFIVNNDNHQSYPFDGSDGLSRTIRGTVHLYEESPGDIIGDWVDPPAPAASPDRMEVWVRFACAALDGGTDLKLKAPVSAAKSAIEIANIMTAEYERQKAGET